MKLRKFLPLIAVLLLMLVAIPLMVVSASAEEAELTPSEGLEYVLSGNKKYYQVKGIGAFEGTDLVIPETYNGLPVEVILQGAFQKQTQLTSVVLPDTIRFAGHAAFNGCTGLQSVKLSSGLRDIGTYMFADCTSLTSISFPAGVQFIGGSSFRGCNGLTEIDFGPTVTTISTSAFRSCRGLTSLVLPDTITKIDHASFHSCAFLKEVTLSKNMAAVANYAFYNCRNLVTVNFQEGNQTVGEYTFEQCVSLKNVNFSSTVHTIKSRAFRECKYLKNVTLPEGLVTLNSTAFALCERLESVVIPTTLTTIGNNAFTGCSALKAVYYAGDEAAWNEINTNSNGLLLQKARYYYSEEDPQAEGFWHYVKGVPTVWEVAPSEFTVTFNANGQGTAPAAQTVVAGATATAPAAPTATGYTFGGWYTDAACTAAYDFAAAVNADVVLYAKWTINSYTVTFDANGQGVAPEAQTVVYGAVATAPEALVATGYTFGGWYADADCTVAFDFAAAVTADVTVYAKWTVVTFTVTFDANGEGTAPAAQTVEYGKTATQPADLVASDPDFFEFGGWYADADCTVAFDFAAAVTSDVTVYAKWIETIPDDVVIGGNPDDGDLEMPEIGI